MKIQLSELRRIIRKTIKEAKIGVTSPMSGLAEPMMTGGGAEQPSGDELNMYKPILKQAIDDFADQKVRNPGVKFARTLDVVLGQHSGDVDPQKMKNYIKSAANPGALFSNVPGIKDVRSGLLAWAGVPHSEHFESSDDPDSSRKGPTTPRSREAAPAPGRKGKFDPSPKFKEEEEDWWGDFRR